MGKGISEIHMRGISSVGYEVEMTVVCMCTYLGDILCVRNVMMGRERCIPGIYVSVLKRGI